MTRRIAISDDGNVSGGDVTEVYISTSTAIKYVLRIIAGIIFMVCIGVALASCALPLVGAAAGLGSATYSADERTDLEHRLGVLEKWKAAMEDKDGI